MKYIAVVFTLCFVGAFAGITMQEQQVKLKNFKKACIDETGVNENVVFDAVDGKQVEYDEKLNCFAACVLKKYGIMRDDGSIDEAIARSEVPDDLVPKEKVDEVINTCKTKVGKNSCETGGKILDCVAKIKGF